MAKPAQRPRQPRAGRPNMPGYGIEGGDKGLLRWSWAVRKMTEARNYFLSTVRPDCRPHVMPIWGVWFDNAFYFSTGKKSVKGRNLAGNANCVICPEGGEEALILEGTAEKVTDPAALKKFAKKYISKYNFDPTTMDEPIFVIRCRVVFGQIEKTFVKTATRWVFGR